MEGYHKPVLLPEVLAALRAETILLALDATAGDGGHMEGLLQAMPPQGRVIGIDQDPQALQRATRRLAGYANRFQVVRGNFRDLSSLLAPSERGRINAILADLGISTLQISDPEKGFMFSADGPLSMQMDPDSGLNAETVINDYDEAELGAIIRNLGEEHAWRRIAHAIGRERGRGRIVSTRQLADIVQRAVPGMHAIKSCARVFQSLRIHINDELGSLEEFLPRAVEMLAPGGRLALISYHSLEDRRVKEFMRDQANPCICPPKLPRCVCGAVPRLKLIGKLVVPSAAEVAANPSARSARLRVAEKLAETNGA